MESESKTKKEIRKQSTNIHEVVIVVVISNTWKISQTRKEITKLSTNIHEEVVIVALISST